MIINDFRFVINGGKFSRSYIIERFHSRGKQLCKFLLEQKKVFTLEKYTNPTRLS